MSELNADCPTWDCLVKSEYLYDLKEHHGEYEEATVFGVASICGRALGFWALIHGTGAVIGRLPISALVARRPAPDSGLDVEMALDQIELWDCFSYELSVHEFRHLCGRRCMVILKDGVKYEGEYLFTVDWYGNDYAENAGNSGWKCAHIIELTCGVYAAQPNNRILWADPANITEPFKKVPDYKTMSTEFRVEGTSRWGTTDGMFYDVRMACQGPPPPDGTERDSYSIGEWKHPCGHADNNPKRCVKCAPELGPNVPPIADIARRANLVGAQRDARHARRMESVNEKVRQKLGIPKIEQPEGSGTAK